MKKLISLTLAILILALCTSSLLSCQPANQPEIAFTKVETKGTVYILVDKDYGQSQSGNALYVYGDYAFLVDYDAKEYFVIHKSVIRQVYWDLYAHNDVNEEIEEAAINDFLNKDAISYDNGYFVKYVESRNELAYSGFTMGYTVIYNERYFIGR